MPSSIIHIVASLHGIGGASTHSSALQAALRERGQAATLWSDRPGPSVGRYGGLAIQPFSGALPRGGTLVLVGTNLQLSPWITHAKPRRLILICINSDPVSLQTALANLQHPTLPPAELVYVSRRLRNAMGIPGRICPEIVDLALFRPAMQPAVRPCTIGRLSRDTPEKHHPEDASLYRMLAWRGSRIRVMGGSCLADQVAGTPGIELLTAGQEPAPDFLRTLDVFFYRTREDWSEPSGRVVMEALACGLPVVAHTSGGYADWIRSGENGFLFSAQEEARDALLQLGSDQALRNRLACNARQTAEELAAANGHLACEYLDWLSQPTTEPAAAANFSMAASPQLSPSA
jgi:glycosyltransferase involved in cell wall biosynthesis